LQEAYWLITSLNHRWKLYHNLKKLAIINNAEDLVGSTCMLLKNKENKVYLTDFEKNVLCNLPVVAQNKLLNNRFVLTFADGTRRLYHPNGKPVGVAVMNQLLFADGRFVNKDRQRITGLYGANGIVDTTVETPTKALNYELYFYSLTWYDKSILFDANGKNISEDYLKITAADNFILSYEADKVSLFNQFGNVLTCNL
jgi:hypothetical protein